MTTVKNIVQAPIKNENLKNVRPMNAKAVSPLATKESASQNISDKAKSLNAINSDSPNSPNLPIPSTPPTSPEAASAAAGLAKSLSKIPILPMAIPNESKEVKELARKTSDLQPPKLSFIKKPALIFIEGFSAFGISNGDGIKEMADNMPGAKRFTWDEQDKILEEIKKHAPDQPVVLVGHSFGGDSAVEIANALNTVKNGFRSIDLLVSIDSVGMNHSIIPMNVKRNLNFFGEGVVPFLHGDPNVARNTDYSEVINELRSGLHSKMDDNQEVQFKIFESINNILSETHHSDLFVEIQKNDQLKEFIDNLHRLKP
ncbi:MAG: hypothetical protein KBD76_12420 [Bacteriovorax sp.]|nr:hypothetical protein [Bacteriovorax sp.]